jgi:hypothetical protein
MASDARGDVNLDKGREAPLRLAREPMRKPDRFAGTTGRDSDYRYHDTITAILVN